MDFFAANYATVKALAEESPYIALATALAVVGATWYFFGRKKQVGPYKMKPKQNTNDVVIFSLGRWDHGPSPSPGCMKLEAYCRLAKIPYKYDNAVTTGPTERWPFISHRGEYVCDSNTCIEYLAKTFKPTTIGDDHLSAEDRALGDIITRFLEQGVYFHNERVCWEYNFEGMCREFRFGDTPNFVKKMIMNSIRGDMIKMLDSQGTGDRTKTELYADLLRDVKSLELFLPQEGKFFGNSARPSSYDTTLYAYLQMLGSMDLVGQPEYLTFVRTSHRIQSYVKLVEQAAFPDLSSLVKETKNQVAYPALA